MNILLTGYKGFIGGHMIRELRKRGHRVVGFEWGDELPVIAGYDWVIHLGAITSTTEKNVEKLMQQNTDFTNNLYNLCASNNVNFQFSSSASVYGLRCEFKESSPVDPRTPYAWSKYMSERHILLNTGLATTQIFRYFNVFGPEGEEHKGNQASPHYQFDKQALHTGTIKVFFGSDHYYRDFIHVSKVIDTQIKFLEKPVSGLFNIGTGKTRSFLDIAEEISKQHNAKIVRTIMPSDLQCSYQRHTRADMTKTNTLLNQ